MVVRLSVTAGRRLIVNPEPAYVRRGEEVSWDVSFAPANDPGAIQWTVYFKTNGNPFKPGEKELEIKLLTTESGGHTSEFNAGKAVQTGDYKYGVLIENATTGQQLSDDDPHLVVL